MPEDNGAGEKSEEPTPRKQQQSRQEGQVAFSTEVNNAILLLCGFGLLMMMGPMAWGALSSMMQASMTTDLTADLSDAESVLRLIESHSGVWTMLMGFMGMLFLLGLGVSMAQVGIQITGKPLMPKWNRISPLSGLKRLFGMRGVMRFIFSVLKMTAIVTVAVIALRAAMPSILYYTLDIDARFAQASMMIIVIALIIAGTLAAIALFDFLYQRWQHNKDMMMTKQEVKEEMKQSDGDPLVKAKIRQIQRQMAQSRMMQEVPKADVVITNPTHVAVALRYDQDSMAAPVVVAKGYDLIAKRIKSIAAENGIVQVENVTLARALAKEVKVGRAVPIDFYQQVAEVLSYVYKLKKRVG